MDSVYYSHPSAVIDESCRIGKGTRIWHFSHICSEAKIGNQCNLGQNTYVAGGVEIGDRVKIQNNVAVYEGVILEDDVFLGPSCVFTNILNPRSQIIRKGIYEKTLIRRGATIGANATVLCGITVGRYAFIGAGAVVRANVCDYAMVLGVPAKQRGWMSRHGHVLKFDTKGKAACPESGLLYELKDNHVRCLDLPEDAPLPEEMAKGRARYSALKSNNPDGIH